MDQNGYRDEESQKRRAAAQQGAEVADTGQSADVDVYFHIKYLKKALTDARSLKRFGGKSAVNVELCLDMLAGIENTLDESTQQGQHILDQRNEIIKEAHGRAATIIDDANLEAEQIKEAARSRASSRVNEAEQQAEAIKKDAKELRDVMIKEAEKKADELIDNEGIMRQANEEAFRRRTDAMAFEEERKRMAYEAADRILSDLFEKVKKTLDAIESDMRRIGKGD